jgi:hypothetical protein
MIWFAAFSEIGSTMGHTSFVVTFPRISGIQLPKYRVLVWLLATKGVTT